MDSTFWSRCEQLGIGRLTREATAEALTGPADTPPMPRCCA